jgi:N-acetylmuramoyl-L-alanine amidase
MKPTPLIFLAATALLGGAAAGEASEAERPPVHTSPVHASSPFAASPQAGLAPRPPIVQSRIPFGTKRKAEMRRYARRHYGIGTYALRNPKVIVEHFTGNESYSATYQTFAVDRPDVELHELPGVCAHFVIDNRGVIHQLVSLRIMCRHTVGLNWTAIGIEHVGTSDGEVMGNRRQLAASLRLTRWLQSRYGVRTRNVIGHNESLSSPYHHERVPALQHQTHGDFRHATMQEYRRRLGRAGAAAAATPPAVSRRVLLGHSVRGRPIVAIERGDPAARRKILVVGVIHGNETGGLAVIRRLRRVPLPAGADFWLLNTINPDGIAAHTRQNAHGVDLNRNFPANWRPLGRPGDLTWSGPGPLSEPESRIARALIRRIRPSVTVWFHQPLGLVDLSGGDARIERRFARRARLPVHRLASYPGSATRWQNHTFRGTTAFVVELPRGALAQALRDRLAVAVRKLAG